MSFVYLLDTNILSEQLKPKPDLDVIEFLEKNEDVIATCSPALHELQFGMESLEDGKKKKVLESYIHTIRDTIPIFDYTPEASVWHAKERAKLIKAGKTPSFVDGMIASIAHTQSLKLVTKNAKDFKMYKVEVVSF